MAVMEMMEVLFGFYLLALGPVLIWRGSKDRDWIVIAAGVITTIIAWGAFCAGIASGMTGTAY